MVNESLDADSDQPNKRGSKAFHAARIQRGGKGRSIRCEGNHAGDQDSGLVEPFRACHGGYPVELPRAVNFFDWNDLHIRDTRTGHDRDID